MGHKVFTPPASGGLTTAGLPAVVYVSPTGDDTTGQRGNAGKPFATIAAALAASSAEDVLELAPGTYTGDVAWTERRSLRGAGSRASIIDGQFALTAAANTSAQQINLADVQITGNIALNFAAKTAGDVAIDIRDCIFGGHCTLTRPINGSYSMRIYGTQCAGIMRPNGAGAVVCTGCEFAAFTFTATAGGEQIWLEACIIPTVTISAGTIVKTAGCVILSALTCGVDFAGTITTTGCDMRTATITIEAATWYEYGSTFVQSNVAGASGNKRVSFQRIASRVCTGGTVTTLTLPIPLGATDYHVSITQLSANNVAPVWYVLNKTGTTFQVRIMTADDESFEFGIFYRVL